jgi:hypothetical protein
MRGVYRLGLNDGQLAQLDTDFFLASNGKKQEQAQEAGKGAIQFHMWQV